MPRKPDDIIIIATRFKLGDKRAANPAAGPDNNRALVGHL